MPMAPKKTRSGENAAVVGRVPRSTIRPAGEGHLATKGTDPMTEFLADQSVLPTIKLKLAWAERRKLIRRFTCTPTADGAVHTVTIHWWDPIDEPLGFVRAHDKSGTGSAWHFDPHQGSTS